MVTIECCIALLLWNVIYYTVLRCWFFFCKLKTAYEMRISDWSSDVFSSELPPMAAALMRFEAKFEGHAAKDQTQQHENKRQHECAKYDGVSQWESRQQARTAQYQPGFVAVPDRRHGIHHDVPVFFPRDEGEQYAYAQVEAVHDDIHKDAEQNDNGPEQC